MERRSHSPRPQLTTQSAVLTPGCSVRRGPDTCRITSVATVAMKRSVILHCYHPEPCLKQRFLPLIQQDGTGVVLFDMGTSISRHQMQLAHTHKLRYSEEKGAMRWLIIRARVCTCTCVCDKWERRDILSNSSQALAKDYPNCRVSKRGHHELPIWHPGRTQRAKKEPTAQRESERGRKRGFSLPFMAGRRKYYVTSHHIPIGSRHTQDSGAAHISIPVAEVLLVYNAEFG